MPRNYNRFYVDDEILKQLKSEAIRAAYHADATLHAYEQAMKDLFERELTVIIGQFSKSSPAECVINFQDNPATVFVFGISISYSDVTPQIRFNEKLKSGKRSKLESTCGDWALSHIKRVNPTAAQEPAK